MSAASVRLTFLHAFKGIINRNPFRTGQKLELKPQLHYKFELKVITLYYSSAIYVVEGGMKNYEGGRGVAEKYIEYLCRAPHIHGSTECKARLFTQFHRTFHFRSFISA
jgi:hypothetical protein